MYALCSTAVIFERTRWCTRVPGGVSYNRLPPNGILLYILDLSFRVMFRIAHNICQSGKSGTGIHHSVLISALYNAAYKVLLTWMHFSNWNPCYVLASTSDSICYMQRALSNAMLQLINSNIGALNEEGGIKEKFVGNLHQQL